jgi:ribosomal protein L7/L12
MLSTAIVFMLAGILNLIDTKYIIGFSYISLALIYFIISIVNYRTIKKTNKTVSDEELKIMDNQLKKLISKGDRIKAIKQCRMVTGYGLKEADEYVKNLIVSNIDLINMNNELRKMITQGNRIKAVKKCREITGYSLKQAEEYIKSLNN